MTGGFTFVLVSHNAEASSPFPKSLQDKCLRTLSVCGVECTVSRSSHEPVDDFLINQEDAQFRSTIGSQPRPLFRNTPVVLICIGRETIAPSFGLEAICYTGSLDERLARIVPMLCHDLLIQEPYSGNNGLRQSR